MEDIFPQIDSVILSAQHALYLGHKPGNLSLKQMDKVLRNRAEFDTSSLGLFDSSTPNYTTFYPEVEPEHFNPKDEDFISPVFRMLSMTTVHKNWNPISFAKPGVLESSQRLLLGATINIDHETAVGNAIGSISDVYWQESYKVKGGIIVPAGIMATMKIDAKSNPRIARGILMDPPSIHSNSVTVFFKWEQSHPELSSEEFFNKLGTYDKEGKLIERVVTEIVGYSETSLVGMGADPYAQITGKDGKIVNPVWANDRTTKLAENIKKGLLPQSVDFKSLTSLSETIPTGSFNNEDKDKDKSSTMKNIPALAAILSFALPEGQSEWTEELFQAALEEHQTNHAQLQADLDAANEQVTTLTGERDSLQTQLDAIEVPENLSELEANAAIGKAALEEARTEAERLYRVLCNGDEKVKPSILTVIKNSDYNTAKDFIEDYKEQLGDRYEGAGNAQPGEGNGGTSSSSNTDSDPLDKFYNAAKNSEKSKS